MNDSAPLSATKNAKTTNVTAKGVYVRHERTGASTAALTAVADDPLVIHGAEGVVMVALVRDRLGGWRVRLRGDVTLTAGEMVNVVSALSVKANLAHERNRGK